MSSGESVSRGQKRRREDRSAQESLSLSSIKNYFDKKFEDIQTKFEKDNHKLAKKFKKEPELSFKFKGNKKQYEFNESIRRDLETLGDLIKQGSKHRSTKMLQEIVSNIEKRNKLIKIADRSIVGWSTVDEYISDDLASDSADERKIKAAENRAIRKKQNTFNRTRKSKFSDVSSTISKAPDKIQFRNAESDFRRVVHPSATSFKPTGTCFSCGKNGHWRKYCPEAKR